MAPGPLFVLSSFYEIGKENEKNAASSEYLFYRQILLSSNNFILLLILKYRNRIANVRDHFRNEQK